MSGSPRLPLRNERVALVGQTGTGKTYAGQLLTSHSRRILFIDSKRISLRSWGLETFEPNPHFGARSLLKKGASGLFADAQQNRRIANGDDFRLRFIPPFARYNYERLWEWVWNTGNMTVYIDEAYRVLPSRGQSGPWLEQLYTAGRESPHDDDDTAGIGMWAAMQRPTYVPLFMLTECQWYFMFELTMDNDRKRMAEMMGDEAKRIDWAKLPAHAMLVKGPRMRSPRLYPNGITGGTTPLVPDLDNLTA